MPQAQHIEVFKYNMMLTVLSAIKRVISLFLLSEEKTNQGHMEVKQLASDHTAFRQLSQSLNSDILSGNMCYRNREGNDQFSSVQLLSRVRLVATPWPKACQASLTITNSWRLHKLVSSESVMPSNHLTLCRPLLLPPSIFLSIRVFSNESVLRIRWPKNWSFSFSISPSNEYSGLISFRIDWLDLLAVQGTLKSLLQHHSSKASILRCSAFL